MHRFLEFLVALPVTVGLSHDDAALEQESLQHLIDIKRRILGVAHAQGDIFEVTEQGQIWRVGISRHAVELIRINFLLSH